MEREPSAIKILDKALRVLTLFTRESPEWGITDLAAEASIPKSTIHRIVRVLCEHEMLSQDPVSRRYRLGLAALRIGRLAQEGTELRHVAGPILNQLAAASGETVTLQVMNQNNDAVVCLDRVQRRAGLHFIMDVGNTAPLHAGSSSKILLAYQPDEVVEAVIARGLPPLTPSTIVDPDQLRKDLVEIRGRGFAVSFEETDLSVVGVSTAIVEVSGTPVGALTIAGPITRMTPSAMRSHLALARDGARRISEELGARPNQVPPVAVPDERSPAFRPPIAQSRGA